MVTKSVLNSGKSFLTNTELTQPVPITEIQTSNWKELTSITMKPLVAVMSQEPSSWTWNQEPWTQSELAHSDNSSDQTTSFSDKPEPEITGPKDITPKELNWLTQFLMLSEKKPKDATVFKDSKSPTPWEVEPDLVWEPFWFPKSEKNTQTESWKPSQLSHPQKFPTPSLNHTTLPCLSINWSKTPMSAWSLITKLFMIFVSELWNWPPQPMVTWTIWYQLPCLVSLAAYVSQVNWTLIWENWLSTWFHSQDSISSWLVSLHWPQEDLNNIEL